MIERLGVGLLCILAFGASRGTAADWWNPTWRFRTSVVRPTLCRDGMNRPVQVAVDFPLLLERAGVKGRFDPNTVRVVDPTSGHVIPSLYRTEYDPRAARERPYVAWLARPAAGTAPTYDLYFDTEGRGLDPATVEPTDLPPQNLLANPGFESGTDGWSVSPPELVALAAFGHTTGERSLRIRVDEATPDNVDRLVTVSQRVDVTQFAGQEALFECDLLAERATYGAPMTVELVQYRPDGSQIDYFVIGPRWLTVELAEGQLVQFSERGRISHEAAAVEVRIRFRCLVRDADSAATVTGPEAHFTIWLDRMVFRPGERWPWPPASHAGFVEGALPEAPVNRAFEFTGQRRLCFNGGSEATLTAGRPHGPETVHWGLQQGTLEFWCRPSWSSDDGAEHVLYYGRAYGHRLQSVFRKLAADGGNELEFVICDSAEQRHAVRGRAALQPDQWHHLAATWDLPAARLQLFADGERVGAETSAQGPWPSAREHSDDLDVAGLGISENDKRSLPMQAYIGGDPTWGPERSADAAIDEFRISDVVRYADSFAPSREEFVIDDHTRALFHLDNERHGAHAADDRFVRGYLSCELPPTEERVPLEVRREDGIDRREVVIAPHPAPNVFERNRAETRTQVTRPFRKLPDPRFVECRPREVERVVDATSQPFTLKVGGDFAPLMRAVTFEVAEPDAEPTLIPRWRANDNVVPFSVQTLAETLAPGAKPDAEKAVAVMKYALATTNYFDAHYCETVAGRHRPRVSYTLVKALNIYPFDQCGPMNHMLRKLFLTAGISSNNASGTHHQIEQAFFDGSLRLFDLSSRVYWLNRDGTTHLSMRGLEEDPYLKLRQGGDPNAWLPGRPSQATFGTAERPHSMDFALRPGERASLCWHNEGRWFELTGDREPIPLAMVPPYFGNGAIVFSPVRACDGVEFDNLDIAPAGVQGSVLRAHDGTREASLVYHAACPYIISAGQVTGSYAADAPGAATLSLSVDDGQTWSEVWQADARSGSIAVDLTDHVSARYAYRLRLQLAAGSGASVGDFRVRSTVVVSPLSLPGKLSLGENHITFVGGSSAGEPTAPIGAVSTATAVPRSPGQPVRTRCRWVERHRSKLGVSLDTLSYYNDEGDAHRNVLIVPPAGQRTLTVTLQGRPVRGEIALEDLPDGWRSRPETQTLSTGEDPVPVEFTVQAPAVAEGSTVGFTVVIRESEQERRVPAQALVARAPLVCEAEASDQVTDSVERTGSAELSGTASMKFAGDGSLRFSLGEHASGPHALWFRARWDRGSSTSMSIAVGDTQRDLRAEAMIGFTDWTNPRLASTKMFAHYGEQYAHWAWYRVPDIELSAAALTLSAGQGAEVDALLLLPQNPAVDRAAMDLFQNWNFSPWENPL